jgi:hypothetical protein
MDIDRIEDPAPVVGLSNDLDVGRSSEHHL